MKLLLIISLLLLTSLLTGCGTPGHNVTITTHSAKYLNPDIRGNPSPLLLTLLALRSSVGFNQASYRQLQNNSVSALNNNLIDKQSIELRPGETQKMTQSITSDTRYIGLIAAYRNIDQARWRALVPISHQEKNTSILVFLETQRLLARKIKHHGIL